METLIECVPLAIIAWFSLCGLNKTTRSTRASIMVATILLFAGSASRIVIVLYGESGFDPSVIVILWAIAVGFLVNRRRSFSCPCLPSVGRLHGGERSHQ